MYDVSKVTWNADVAAVLSHCIVCAYAVLIGTKLNCSLYLLRHGKELLERM